MLKEDRDLRILVIILSILICVILCYYAYFFTPNFVYLVDLNLDSVFDVRLGPWSLQNSVFALVVGTAPIFASIVWRISGYKQANSLIFLNLVIGGLISLFVAFVFLMMIAFAPRGIFDTIKQPSLHFWNYVLVGCDLLNVVIVTIFSFKHAKRHRWKNQIELTKDQIDQ